MNDNSTLNCHLCHSADLKLIPGVRDFEFDRPCEKPLYGCRNCGVVAMYPMPEAKEIKTFYGDYHVYQDRRPKLIQLLVRVFNHFQRRDFVRRLKLRRGNILDIGCATGTFLKTLERAGEFELWGIDIDEDAITECRRKGINAHVGTIETVALPKRHFDVIIMNNVIEHVPDPERLLRVCLDLLKPGGKVYGETPTTRCISFYLSGRYWFGFHYPRHLFVFCQRNLLKIAATAGFAQSHCYSVIHPGSWAVTMENIINEALPRPLKRNRGRTILGAPMMLAFLPLNFIEVLFGAAGMMRFILEKPAQAPETSKLPA